MAGVRLIRRLREHDWLAASIELVIVVVGILLALKVSNCNQDRVDRERGARYVARLEAEIATDRASMDEAIAFWKQVGAFGEGAMAHSESGARVANDAWKTVLAYYQASQLYPFELEDTTFLEMRDAGGLALIEDERLRKRIAETCRASPTLLAHLREWMSTMRISAIIVDGMRNDADALAGALRSSTGDPDAR